MIKNVYDQYIKIKYFSSVSDWFLGAEIHIILYRLSYSWSIAVLIRMIHTFTFITTINIEKKTFIKCLMSYPTIANVKQKLIFNKSNPFSAEGYLKKFRCMWLDQSVRVLQLFRTDKSGRVILQGNSLKTWVFKKDIVKIKESVCSLRALSNIH